MRRRPLRFHLSCSAVLAIAGLTLVACSASPGLEEPAQSTSERVVSGADDRIEVANAAPGLRAAGSQVGLIAPYLFWNADGTINYDDYGTASSWYNLCPTQPFVNQPVIGAGTAYLVSPARIVTVGHAINGDPQTFCGQTSFVFHFETDANGTAIPFSQSQVYRCRYSPSQGKYAAFAYKLSGEIDYAVIDLDRPVTDASGNVLPGLVPAESQVTIGQSIAMIGHGAGLPAKVSPGIVTSYPYDPYSPDRFGINADGFAGNSGSPVVDTTTLEVFGIAAVAANNDAAYTDGAMPCGHWASIPSGQTFGVSEIGQAIANHFAPSADWTGGTPTGTWTSVVPGDVNGDGRDDLVFFTFSSVWFGSMRISTSTTTVRLSTGGSFAGQSQSTGGLCLAGEQCFVADVDGDGRSDIVAVAGGFALLGTTRAPGVYWSKSTGAGFGSSVPLGGSTACTGTEVCKVGDVNGDGLADVVAFDRTTTTTGTAGDVYVSLGSPSGLQPRARWATGFCEGTDTCDVADVNGDRKADVVDMVRNAQPWPVAGDTFVALSSGSPTSGFGFRSYWQGSLCVQGGACILGDVNGDGRADAVELNEDPGTSIHATAAALAKNGSFGPLSEWNNDGCQSTETCVLADVNADGRKDFVAVGGSTLRVGLATPRFTQ